ncbi:MAG: serine protease [Bacteriovoracaceae bacterium]|jgi:V8-like Glu-specific endopeptidase|nr:serine protease [Bacteriovoracaceae bacterium]
MYSLWSVVKEIVECKLINLSLFFVFLLGCFPALASRHGIENRRILTKETYNKSIGALHFFDKDDVESSTLVKVNEQSYRLKKDSVSALIESQFGKPLCEDNISYKLESSSLCTVFLISDDEVATAGHCLQDEHYSFIKNYDVDLPFRIIFGHDLDTVKVSDVYSVTSIVNARNNPFFGDYAILKLDRKVVGVKPLSLNVEAPRFNKSKIYTIGYPLGSTKQIIAESGNYTEYYDMRGHVFYSSNLDINAGASGSPVFDSSGVVIGIVSRTLYPEGYKLNEDFTLNSSRGCVEDIVFSDNLNTTGIQRLDRVFYKNINWDFQDLISLGTFERHASGLHTVESFFRSNSVNINSVYRNYKGHDYSALAMASLLYIMSGNLDSVNYLLDKGVIIDKVSMSLAKSQSSDGDTVLEDLFKEYINKGVR